MTKVRISFKWSKDAIKRETVRTGQTPYEHDSIDIDLVDLPEEQRQPLVDFLFSQYGNDIENKGISLTEHTLDPSAWNFMRGTSAEFDTPPTVEDVLAYIQREATVQKDAKAALREKERRQQEEDNQNQERLDAFISQIEHLEETEDINGLRELPLPIFSGHGLNQCIVEAGNAKDNAINRLRDIFYYRSMDAWIADHGSEQLKKARARGHEASRIYALERAAIELPGYQVDIYHKMRYQSRQNPSLEALQEADRIEAAMPDLTAQVVWLTVVPRFETDDLVYNIRDHETPYCEAVVVHRYLGKYDAALLFLNDNTEETESD